MEVSENHKDCGVDPLTIDEIYLKLIFNKDEQYFISEECLNDKIKLNCYLILKSLRSMLNEIDSLFKGKQNVLEDKSKKNVILKLKYSKS
ncbi:hypothetical protein ACQ4LE_000612 [Meloidogyne hapla]